MKRNDPNGEVSPPCPRTGSDAGTAKVRGRARGGLGGFVVVVVMLALAACADSEPSGSPDTERQSSGQARASGDRTGDEAGSTTDQVQLPEPGADGSRTITGEGGTPAIILPPEPRRTTVPASRGCEKKQGNPEQPPTPGLRADRAGRVVFVTYDLPALPARCKPHSVRLTLYVTATGLSQTFNYRIRSDGRQRVPVPEHFTSPDVVRASTVTSDGRRSDVASVRIR
jgi:hypothetical protein